jgi:tetratricopeptide (TPR) repeat protein
MARAEALVEGARPSPIRARVLGELTRYHMLGGRDEEAVAVGREALAMAEQLGLDPIRAATLSYVGASRVRLGDRQGLVDMRRGIEISAAANSPEVVRGHTNLGVILSQMGELDEAVQIMDEGLRIGERFGSTDMLHWLTIQRRGQKFARGHWDDSLPFAEEIITGERHYSQKGAFSIRSTIRLARGDMPGAVEDADRSLELAREAQDPQALLPSLAHSAFVSLAAGRAADAESLVDELLALDPARYETGPVLFHLSWVLRALGRTDEFAMALSRATLETRWVGAARAIADGELARAAEIYAEAGALPFEAYTRLRAAEAGEPDAQLDKAISFYRRAGAKAYLAEAEQLLKATA